MTVPFKGVARASSSEKPQNDSGVPSDDYIKSNLHENVEKIEYMLSLTRPEKVDQ